MDRRTFVLSTVALAGARAHAQDKPHAKLSTATGPAFPIGKAGERWAALTERGARSQRCLWASTSTKNPEYRDVIYVEELIGPETVNTMPEETIEAFQDHGEVALTLDREVDEAERVFEQVAEAGVDYDDVVATLEREGVDKFADSFKELLDGVRSKRGELVSA